MRFIPSFCLILLLVLTGCASKPMLMSEPVVMNRTKAAMLWQPYTEDFNIGVVPKADGTVITVRYLIDSNGDVHNIEILEATPDNEWTVMAKRSLRHTTHTPTRFNPDRKPVIVEDVMYFGY